LAVMTGPAPVETTAARAIGEPLRRLRRGIRLYVFAEGLALVLVYVGLWFWLGLLADYGVFEIFAVDWVQELPRSVRGVILLALTAGFFFLVSITWLRRLLPGIREQALAIILERRFSGLLGDRVITSVELADAPDSLGYSRPMLERTMAEAAERIERVRLRDVFDWQRLRRVAVRALVWTVGLYCLVGAAYCIRHRAGPLAFARRFENVALIWVERNILLRDTIWPRKAHLELLNEQFRTADEMRVGRDAPPPTLRVRAWKWVIADGDRARAPEGWRALLFKDLDRLGERVDVERVPMAWRDWSLDRIEMEVASGSLQSRQELGALFTRLHDLAASPSGSRLVRELEIPEEVTVNYTGASSRSEQTLQKQVGNEYSGLADVKETVRFTVRGRNYYTPPKWIRIVPPPSIVDLKIEESQPAYLHHHPPRDGSATDLRGLKQIFPARPITLTGDTSRIDVPAGTDLVLTCKADKDLEHGISLVPARANEALPAIAVNNMDSLSFSLSFKNLSTLVDFNVRMIDTDGVAGGRHLIIKPVEDAPPEVDAQVEVVRKTGQGYLVTPAASVPMSGRIRDDHGLAQVHYSYLLERSNTPLVRDLSLFSSAWSAAPDAPMSLLWAVFCLTDGKKLLSDPALAAAQTQPMQSFDQLLRERVRDQEPLSKLKEALRRTPSQQLLTEYSIDPDIESFSVSALDLKVNDERAVQPHYRLQLWVTATDNNIETGPRTGQGKERFVVLVVSENELLAEIAKEEESLHVKLDEAVTRLKDSRVKLEKISEELPGLKANEFSPLARRAEDMDDAVVRSWDACREVLSDYKRILKELKVNRVQPGMIAKVSDKICDPLDAAINLEFVNADEAVRDLTRKLDSHSSDRQAVDAARQSLDQLIARLASVLDAMADVTSINKIIEMLVKIEMGERQEYERLQLLLKQKQEEFLDNLSEPRKPK
jgi:hypothetical protein